MIISISPRPAAASSNSAEPGAARNFCPPVHHRHLGDILQRQRPIDR